jgi:ABC-type antimicrobial peptide transport system permease subunit
VSAFLSDFRYAIRGLSKSPGFTAVAVLVLALGIGLNTAVFSLINVVLLRPMPGEREPGRVVGVYSFDTTRPNTYRAFSYPNYADIRDRNQVFSQTTALGVAMVGIGDGDLTRREFAFIIPANFFATFGVQPAIGRGFLPDEERPGANRLVAVIGHEQWNRMGADRAVLGRTIRVNARNYTIIGVAPRGFGGPSTIISPAVFLPLGVYETVVNDLFREGAHDRLDDRANHGLILMGRLKPGLTLEATGPPLKVLGDQLEQAFPGENKNQSLIARPLSRVSITTNPNDDSQIVATFVLVQAMAASVLLIACMNLANMLLARSTARRREIAVRLAIGANRARVIRQLLTEGFALSLVGGVVGLLLAFWAVRLLSASIDPMIPMLLSVDALPDVRVLAATFGIALLSTLVFGLGPAWRLARTDVVTELKEGDRGGTEGRRRHFSFRHALVVGQIGLSLALLTAAGLFARGAFKAARAEPGFSLDRSVLISLDPSLAGFDEARGRDVYRRLLERARALPGVEAASIASIVPFGDFSEGRQVQKVGKQGSDASKPGGEDSASVTYGAGGSNGPGNDRDGVGANFSIVGRDYFQTLGIPILRGRGFSEAEELAATGPRVAVIDEPLAKRLFPDADPLGQSVYFPGRDEIDTRPLEVVGIVRGTRHSLFDRDAVPHVYVPFGQRYRASMTVHARIARSGTAAEAAALQSLRREVRALDERLPIVAIGTMRENRDRSVASWLVRVGATLFAVFGGLAMFLSVIGVYGIRAYLVSRRSREIGVRMALGASARDVLALVLKEGLVLVAAGLAIGLLLAVGTGFAVASLVYEVGAFDPMVFSVAPMLLALAALVACYVPARRATRVAPVVVLRAE